MRLPLVFEGKIQRSESGCWLWTGTIRPDGYGVLVIDRKQFRAHRVAYELLVGPIPEGMHLDHLCHNRDLSCRDTDSCVHRRCVNPEHLEAVTGGENTSRAQRRLWKTHCPKGHPYDAENTYISRRGHRVCRRCHSDQVCRAGKARRAATPAELKTPNGHHNKIKTHCKHGHEFTEENTRRTPKGRWCRACDRARVRQPRKRV